MGGGGGGDKTVELEAGHLFDDLRERLVLVSKKAWRLPSSSYVTSVPPTLNASLCKQVKSAQLLKLANSRCIHFTPKREQTQFAKGNAFVTWYLGPNIWLEVHTSEAPGSRGRQVWHLIQSVFYWQPFWSINSWLESLKCFQDFGKGLFSHPTEVG